MYKRELKVNFKSLCLWTIILLCLFGICFAIYPSIMNSENSQKINELLAVFPPEVLKMFNMDISGISSVFGFFKTEGMVFYLLLGSLFSAILGSNILVKEESDKTIEFLHSLPVSRSKIVTSKILAGLTNIIIFVIVIFIFNLIGLIISNDIVYKTYIYLSLTPLLLFITIYFISMFLSTFFRKTKITMMLALGFVFISYFLQAIGNMSTNFEWIGYFSVFNLMPTRYILENNSLQLLPSLLGIGISFISIILIYIKYNKKEFI